MAADRYRFVLDRPLVAAPGKRWTYNGGTTAVLAHLIARGTGTTLLDYAREKLLGPLGIADAEWVLGTNGAPEQWKLPLVVMNEIVMPALGGA
jgi:CubicO group peptidase (beta-lactamase class C family)